MTPAQLLAKKPRVELTLMIDEAQKQGFKPDHVERKISSLISMTALNSQPSCEQSRQDVLNSINIEESMHMVRSLLHTKFLY